MSEQDRAVVVLEDGPEMSPRSKRLQWLASAVVVLVLATGVGIWFLQASDPEYRPPIIEGLTEEPDFAWQRALLSDESFTVVAENIAVHPEAAIEGRLGVTMLNPATGELLWEENYSQYVPDQRRYEVWLRDLQGTDNFAIRLTPPGSDTQQVLLVDRTDGAVAASHEIPPQTRLLTSSAGSYLLVTDPDGPGLGGQSIALLGSDDPTDQLWTKELLGFGDVDRFIVREESGYLAITTDLPGHWLESTNRVLSMDDGQRPDWVPDDYATVHFLGDVGVVTRGGMISAHDLETGDQLWTSGDGHRGAWALTGNLFELRRDEAGLRVMRVDPADGAELWPEEVVMPRGEADSVGDFRNLTLAGDDLVALGIAQGQTSAESQTCLAVVDPDTGAEGEWHCHDIVGTWSWGGPDQMILWDGRSLLAVSLSDGEQRWRKDFPGEAVTVRDVGGNLLVHDAAGMVIGVLE